MAAAKGRGPAGFFTTKNHIMAKTTKKDKVEKTAKAFEAPLERMIANAEHALKILNKFSNGKLKEKFDKEKNKGG